MAWSSYILIRTQNLATTYYDFEMKFGVLPEVIFGHAIYHFEVREGRNPTL